MANKGTAMFNTPREERRKIARSGRIVITLFIIVTFAVALAFLFGHFMAR
jgi:hypothetical protein